MLTPSGLRILIFVLSTFSVSHSVSAENDKLSQPAQDSLLFAVEITTGQNWNTQKPPQEQLHFAQHSANLKRLRDAGVLVMGARYSDKGFILLKAKDETHARTMMDADPSIEAGIFQYQVHPFYVFYAGTVNKRAASGSQ